MGGEEEGNNLDFFFDFLVIGLILCVGFLIVFSFVTSQPERYSMVYFAPQGFPSSAIAGQEFSFRFVVENHEGKNAAYSYSVIAEGQAKKSGSLAAGDGEQTTIIEKLSFESPSAEKQKVELKLLNSETKQEYSVFFWVNVSQ